MNKQMFFDQVTQVADQYDQDNQWFGFQRGGQSWSQGTWIQFILAAWKLHEKACTNQLHMILLGDTKIRSDAELLFNFGLVANTNSPQEEKDKQLVADLMAKRTAIARQAKTGPAVEMMGPGSILSAQRWSPMLNDALMLGGIEGGQEFHFALNDDEQKSWASLMDSQSGQKEFEKRRAVFGKAVSVASKPAYGSEAHVRSLWLKFIHTVPRVLWERGNPRVFVRELLGLKFFGYKPVFTLHELGFAPTGGGKPPTFPNYVNGLRDAGMTNRDRVTIMRNLGEFLFGDAKALEGIGA